MLWKKGECKKIEKTIQNNQVFTRIKKTSKCVSASEWFCICFYCFCFHFPFYLICSIEMLTFHMSHQRYDRFELQTSQTLSINWANELWFCMIILHKLYFLEWFFFCLIRCIHKQRLLDTLEFILMKTNDCWLALNPYANICKYKSKNKKKT